MEKKMVGEYLQFTICYFLSSQVLGWYRHIDPFGLEDKHHDCVSTVSQTLLVELLTASAKRSLRLRLNSLIIQLPPLFKRHRKIKASQAPPANTKIRSNVPMRLLLRAWRRSEAQIGAFTSCSYSSKESRSQYPQPPILVACPDLMSSFTLVSCPVETSYKAGLM